MNNQINGEAYRVQVLDRVFQIMDVVSGDGPELGVTELAARLGLHTSTAHRLVMALESTRFLERDAVSGKCRLGSRIMQLGLVALARLNLVDVARPSLRHLVDETRETAHVGLLCDAEVVSICSVQSNHTLRSPSTIGTRTPFHCASQGKAILAFSPLERVQTLLQNRVLQSFTANTITSPTEFLEELEATRERGCAVDDEECEIGLRCLAAPIRDGLGEVVGAVSIAGPSFRVSYNRIPALSSAVIAGAARISTALGHNRSAEDSARRVRHMPLQPSYESNTDFDGMECWNDS
jgi:IclR family transcriptional regulator, KDG regulon repressor